jgi:redox-sensing transcriptional repressor
MGKRISAKIIKRLPRYYRYLSHLMESEVVRISSKELSERMGITASQIRQDLNHFGSFGQQGYGYDVKLLYNQMKNILGLDKQYNVILLGAGNLGKFLLLHEHFAHRGFIFTAVFDKKPERIGRFISDMEIRDLESVDDYVAQNPVDIAALTIPFPAARPIAKRLADAGVKGIWNFSHCDLELPGHVAVEDFRFSDSLMALSYKINEEEIIGRTMQNFW